jgi:hypothetical protein
MLIETGNACESRQGKGCFMFLNSWKKKMDQCVILDWGNVFFVRIMLNKPGTQWDIRQG